MTTIWKFLKIAKAVLIQTTVNPGMVVAHANIERQWRINGGTKMVKLKNLAHFNLRTIMNSGQCFRITEPMFNVFDIISMDQWVRIHYDTLTDTYFFDCPAEEFGYWAQYFDLGTNYDLYFNAIKNSDDEFLKRAADYAPGMRILRQNYWGTIVSFIISQNNNIPRIKKSIEAFCQKFGKPMTKYGVTYYSFPSKEEVANIKLENLKDLGLGYRDKYVYEVCTCNPSTLAVHNLRNITGIGPKVESCIKLFGWHKMDSYPIDTWIRKMIDEVYNGHFDTTSYEGFEGFVQQLQFYYYRHLKGK